MTIRELIDTLNKYPEFQYYEVDINHIPMTEDSITYHHYDDRVSFDEVKSEDKYLKKVTELHTTVSNAIDKFMHDIDEED